MRHCRMYPRRIVCLTEETTETLYLLGEGDRVVGVSGYTVRPPEARQKPRVSSFLHARYDKIEALEPDLILAFSDLQASITTELVSRGYPVFTFNQRSVPEILQMVRSSAESSAWRTGPRRWPSVSSRASIGFVTGPQPGRCVRGSTSKNGTNR